VATGQIGFALNIAKPLFEAFCSRFVELAFVLDQMNDNLDRWKNFDDATIKASEFK
jgi:hypothetical protein